MFDRNAPFQDSTSAWFVFAVDGEEIGSFTEVSGLELNVATEDVEEGGVNGYVHKMPGRMSWPNLTLKRGLTKSDNLLAWIESVSGDGLGRERNKISRRTASITLLTDDGRPLRRWDFVGVVPVRWSAPHSERARGARRRTRDGAPRFQGQQCLIAKTSTGQRIHRLRKSPAAAPLAIGPAPSRVPRHRQSTAGTGWRDRAPIAARCSRGLPPGVRSLGPPASSGWPAPAGSRCRSWPCPKRPLARWV